MSGWSSVRLPDRHGRLALVAAAATWAGVGVGRRPTVLAAALVVGLVVVAARYRRLTLAVLLVCGGIAGLLYDARVGRTLDTVVPEGPIRLQGVMLADSVDRAAPVRVESTDGEIPSRTPLLLRGQAGLVAGRRVVVAGTLSDASGTWRGTPYAGILRVHRLEQDLGFASAWFAVADNLRMRIVDVFGPIDHRGAALMLGFLIGDTSGLPDRTVDDLRAAGLSHFVAVSGSNVALFLMLVWIVVGPIAFDIRRRAAVGMVAVAVFTIVTRWEASVLRAGAMAVLLLGSRAVGFPLSGWSALGVAVTGLLLVAPQLATAVGFQLSVAATIGVMAGVDLFGSIPVGPARRALAAATGAQVAVAPVSLFHFGSVPMASPLANLVAAPFVAAATASGGIAGLTAWSGLAEVSSRIAAVVLDVAAFAAGGPQLGPGAGAAVLAALVIPWRRVRLVATSGVLMVAVLSSLGSALPPSSVAFLDVGQGDAAIVRAGTGEVILIDGGPDAPLLLQRLRSHRISRIDLMVLSHPHEDHVAGLVGVMESLPVRELWHSGFPDGGPTFARLLDLAAQRSVPVSVPATGANYRLGDLELEVLGPLRRYASPNDQSLVLRIISSHLAMLFPGDIEVIAQREIGPVRADVMKVPHQGAATSDLAWLESSRPQLAVVSVGPNQFGHPSMEVLAALAEAGATVLRTDEEGDVLLRLDRAADGQVVGAGSGKS